MRSDNDTAFGSRKMQQTYKRRHAIEISRIAPDGGGKIELGIGQLFINLIAEQVQKLVRGYALWQGRASRKGYDAGCQWALDTLADLWRRKGHCAATQQRDHGDDKVDYEKHFVIVRFGWDW